MKGREVLIRVIKFAVALGLIFYLIKRGYLDLSLVGSLMIPSFIVIGLALVGLNLFLSCLRWQVILKARGFPVSLMQSMALFLIGIFFNYALPGSIGGDVVKAYYIVQDHPSRRMEAVLSVAIDRILGLYSMIIIALVAMALNFSVVREQVDLMAVATSSLILFALMSAFFLTAFSRRIGRLARMELFLSRFPLGAPLIRAFHAAQSLGQDKWAICKALVVSLAAQVIAILFVVLVGWYLKEDIPLAAYFFAVPIGFIVASVPIAPAGLGVGQIAFLVLFQMYLGHPSQVGQTAITALQLGYLAWGLWGAYFYLRRKKPAMVESQS